MSYQWKEDNLIIYHLYLDYNIRIKLSDSYSNMREKWK